MNQSEVDLIYNYLHEYYDYKDGELICKKPIKHSKKVGDKLGTFKVHPEGYGYLVGTFSIDKKVYSKRIAHLVYCYHHRKLPQYIWYQDGNHLNTHIENLANSRIRQPNSKNYYKKNSGFRVEVTIDGETLKLGCYKEEEFAKKAVARTRELALEDDLPAQKIRELILKEFDLLISKEAKPKGMPTGVKRHNNKYRATIRINGDKQHLGTFDTPEQAHEAYKAAKIKRDATKAEVTIESAMEETQEYAKRIGVQRRREIECNEYRWGKLKFELGQEVFYKKEEGGLPYSISKGQVISYLVDSNPEHFDEMIFFEIKDAFTDKTYVIDHASIYKDKDAMESELIESLIAEKDIFTMEEIEDTYFD